MKTTLLECFIIGALCTAVGFVTSGFLTHSISLPLQYEDDALFTALILKNTSEGHVWQLPRLGAPFGSQLLDFPSADMSNVALATFLSVPITNVFMLQNIFYLISFALAGATAYGVLRVLRYAKFLSASAAVLFSTLPYHYVRNDKHLFLSNYAYVPLVLFFIVQLFEKKKWKNNSLLYVITLGVLVGSSGLYAAYFSLLLVVSASLLKWFLEKKSVALQPTVLFLVSSLTVVFLQFLPTLIFRAQKGPNPVVAERHGYEVVNNGLQLLYMAVPLDSYGIASLETFHTTVVKNMEQQQYLGIVCLLGLVLSMYTALGLFFEKKFTSRTKLFSLFVLIICMLGISSGPSALIGYVITAQFRSYSRLIPFLSFFCLALLVETVQTHSLSKKKGILKKNSTAGAAFFTLITLIGIFDQTSWFVPKTNSIRTAFNSDAEFFTSLENDLRSTPQPKVFQLPYKQFPETPPILHSKDYDLLKPYLHTKIISWSYGSSKGREQDIWYEETTTLPVEKLVATLEEKHFSGILIDSFGYTVEELQKLRSSLKSVTHSSERISTDGRWIYIDSAK